MYVFLTRRKETGQVIVAKEAYFFIGMNEDLNLVCCGCFFVFVFFDKKKIVWVRVWVRENVCWSLKVQNVCLKKISRFRFKNLTFSLRLTICQQKNWRWNAAHVRLTQGIRDRQSKDKPSEHWIPPRTCSQSKIRPLAMDSYSFPSFSNSSMLVL